VNKNSLLLCGTIQLSKSKAKILEKSHNKKELNFRLFFYFFHILILNEYFIKKGEKYEMKMKKENEHLMKTLLWAVVSIGVPFALRPFKIDWVSAMVIYMAFAHAMYHGMTTFGELRTNNKTLDADNSTLIKSILLFFSSVCSTIMLFWACGAIAIINYGANDLSFFRAFNLFVIVFAAHFMLTFVLVELRILKRLKFKETKTKEEY
jgi:hypothetical protein